MTADETTPEDTVPDDSADTPDGSSTDANPAVTSPEPPSGDRATPSRTTRLLLVAGAAAVILAGAIIWSVVSSGSPDAATQPAGSPSGAPGADGGSSDAPAPADGSAPPAAGGDGQTPAPGADPSSSPFARDAATALQDMSMDLTQIGIALDQGTPLSATVATLRERAATLRSLTPPSDIADRWSATLDEIDRRLGALENSDHGGAPAQARDSALAIDGLLADLRGIVPPPA